MHRWLLTTPDAWAAARGTRRRVGDLQPPRGRHRHHRRPGRRVGRPRRVRSGLDRGGLLRARRRVAVPAPDARDPRTAGAAADRRSRSGPSRRGSPSSPCAPCSPGTTRSPHRRHRPGHRLAAGDAVLSWAQRRTGRQLGSPPSWPTPRRPCCVPTSRPCSWRACCSTPPWAGRGPTPSPGWSSPPWPSAKASRRGAGGLLRSRRSHVRLRPCREEPGCGCTQGGADECCTPAADPEPLQISLHRES